jgi:c-di-GMP-binding flagellar brake protein YcgR
MSSTGDNLDLLREAIARNAGMVLSLPSGGILRHHKSRFLADAGDGFWVKSVAAEGPLVEQLIANQQPAGVSFRSGDHKVIFATEIQHFKADYELSGPVDDPDGTRVEALLLRFPGEVRSVQRRKSFRVPVAGTDLQVKVWTMPEQANLRDKPATSREIACEARDLSVGGIGLNIRATVRPPNVATGDRIRVQLTLHDTTALLEGRLRYPPRVTPDSSFRAGVQFKALGDSRDDRAASAQLNKIVNDVQREQIRRKKLGLS